MGYSPWSCKDSTMTEHAHSSPHVHARKHTHTHTHTHTGVFPSYMELKDSRICVKYQFLPSLPTLLPFKPHPFSFISIPLKI